MAALAPRDKEQGQRGRAFGTYRTLVKQQPERIEPKLTRMPVNPRSLAGQLDLPSTTKQQQQENCVDSESCSCKGGSLNVASNSSNLDVIDNRISSMIAACDEFLRRWTNHWQDTQNGKNDELHDEESLPRSVSQLSMRKTKQTARRWDQIPGRRPSYRHLHHGSRDRQYFRRRRAARTRHYLCFPPTLVPYSFLRNRDQIAHNTGTERRPKHMHTGKVEFNRKARLTMMWPR